MPAKHGFELVHVELDFFGCLGIAEGISCSKFSSLILTWAVFQPIVEFLRKRN